MVDPLALGVSALVLVATLVAATTDHPRIPPVTVAPTVAPWAVLQVSADGRCR